MARRRRSTIQRPAASGEIELQVSLRRAVAFGPGKARLLAAIDATGSIAAAARETGMSYRRAWGLVIELNGLFAAPLVTGQTGGPSGGGASLTENGRRVLGLYEGILRAIEGALADDIVTFGSMLGDEHGVRLATRESDRTALAEDDVADN
jgi:molybdate transport system regulatory protein